MLLKKDISHIHTMIRLLQPTINAGGCGIFALAFQNLFGGKVLRLDNLNSWVYLIEDEPQHVNIFEEMDNGEDKNNWSATHFIVSYRGMHFDGMGFLKKHKGKWYDRIDGNRLDTYEYEINSKGDTEEVVNTMVYDNSHLKKAVLERKIWNDLYFDSLGFKTPKSALKEMTQLLNTFKQ